MDRAEIFQVIGEERAYQRRRWGVRSAENPREFIEKSQSVARFILYMEDYLATARAQASHLPDGDPRVLDTLRKVVTLGVACFEQHGVPSRSPGQMAEGYVINGYDGQPA